MRYLTRNLKQNLQLQFRSYLCKSAKHSAEQLGGRLMEVQQNIQPKVQSSIILLIVTKLETNSITPQRPVI